MRLAVIDVVGLTTSLIERHGSFLKQWSSKKTISSFPPAFPAVTTTAQSTYLTGTPPKDHGIVGNGWYDRTDAEHKFWKQSNHLVKGEKIWETLRANDPDFTCAKLFWWYNMYSTADYTITPRPMYPADGRKVFDVYTQPMGLREEIKADLGDFPFFTFWGPKAGIACSEWISRSAKWVEEKHSPTLNLIYLPHLDYILQQEGPEGENVAAEFKKIEDVLEDLITYLETRGIEVMLLSEYGISAVDNPIHLNRLFREKGWITIKDELGKEQIDLGASKVFAIADHQVAHVYLNDRSLKEEVKALIQRIDGVESVHDAETLLGNGTGGERAGDLIIEATPESWFTYYYWEDDALAPDYARCIDIHRKCGYDPAELFIDPALKFPPLKMASFLAKKKLGFRTLMDIIPLDATLVKGSHGRTNVPPEEQPIFIGKENVTTAEGVHTAILNHFSALTAKR